MGHMNVMWYTGKFDEASWQFLSNLGLTRKTLGDSNRAMGAVQQNITYKSELYAGDLITVRTCVLEVLEKTIKLLHTMENNETSEIAAESEITGVYFDAASRKSIAFSDEIRSRAKELMRDKEGIIPAFVHENDGGRVLNRPVSFS